MFEDRVEHLLRLSGFSVARNVLVSGTQVDIVATHSAGFATVRYLVECTDQMKSVSIDYVKEKAAVLLNGDARDDMLCVMIVARGTFSAPAREFAREQHRVLLRTEADLERGLVDFSPYRDWYIENYERSTGVFSDASLHEHYVESTAYDSTGNAYPINEAADTWLHDDQNNVLFILGDYGAGKTSFLRQLAYRLLTAPPDGAERPSPIPVLIPLRDYRSAISLRQVITDALLNDYGVRLASFQAFERFCSLGHVILLLDGFDEMAARSNEKTVADCLSQVYILAETNTKLIVTCRSNFFRSHRQVIDSLRHYAIDITDFRPKGRSALPLGRHGTVLTLQTLTEEQIRQFITLRFPDEVDELLETMASIHDLTDLRRRPVLLDMILKTLPDLKRSNEVLNSAALYEHYTNRWTLRDEWRIQMPVAVRQGFCDAIAWSFNARGETAISYSQLHKLLQGVLQELTESQQQLDEYANDIQTCSFIVRAGEGSMYEFAHKSFMEYFVGRRLAKVLAGEAQPVAPAPEDPATPDDFAAFATGRLIDIELPALYRHRYMPSIMNSRLERADAYAYLADSWNRGDERRGSSSASLSAQIEQRVLAMYDVHSDLPFNVSPEVATFALEWLENQGIGLREVIRRCVTPADEQRLADIMRQAAATRYFRSQAAALRGLMTRESANPLLRAAAAGALAQSGLLNTPETLRDARRHLSSKGFAYLLYVMAESDDEAARTAVDALREAGEVDAFGAVIAGLGHRSRMAPDAFSHLMIERICAFAASGADTELALLLTDVLAPDDAGLLTIIEAVIRSNTDQRMKLEAVRMLTRIQATEQAGKRLRKLWVQTTEPRVRAALDRQRARILSMTANRRNRASWSPATSPAARERLWAALRS